ncbi:MAG: His/Gly/Thr/Pro-type tRNA ligase C-terminal domain-containing protein, partial [Candidatus Cloacimonadota bacterium]|nr:His/Gly/Thr/Pro-type tRNA ligase C-terminal domain-containing protein [Candidatus Cloacimonadota bacterium]
KEPHPKVFLIGMGKTAKEYCSVLAQKLRDENISCDIAYEKNSLKAQMKAADKSNAYYTLILGDEELSTNTVTLKNMENGLQKQIPLVSLAQAIKKGNIV